MESKLLKQKAKEFDAKLTKHPMSSEELQDVLCKFVESLNKQAANSNLGAVSGSLLYDKLAVIIQTKDGKIFQVALDKEMSDALFSELKMFFNGGIVKILPTEINGITLE